MENSRLEKEKETIEEIKKLGKNISYSVQQGIDPIKTWFQEKEITIRYLANYYIGYKLRYFFFDRKVQNNFPVSYLYPVVYTRDKKRRGFSLKPENWILYEKELIPFLSDKNELAQILKKNIHENDEKYMSKLETYLKVRYCSTVALELLAAVKVSKKLMKKGSRWHSMANKS